MSDESEHGELVDPQAEDATEGDTGGDGPNGADTGNGDAEDGDGGADDGKGKSSATPAGKKKQSARALQSRAKKNAKKSKGKPAPAKAAPAKKAARDDEDGEEGGDGEDAAESAPAPAKAQPKKAAGDSKGKAAGGDKKGGDDKKRTAATDSKRGADGESKQANGHGSSNGNGVPHERKEIKQAVLSRQMRDQDDYRSCTGTLMSRPRALDVKIGGFSISAWGKELIKDTAIEFTIGRRYGLLGANGSGKSTMLRALAKREVPIPDHIDIFYLDEEAEPCDKTAMDMVIETVQSEMKRIEAMADEVLVEDGPDSDLYMDLASRLEDMDPDTFESRAGKLLSGLGFSKQMMRKKTKDLSGGWRMRVSLAQALFIKPTLLLLDEPTNHLDLEACIWLEQYLSKYNRCLLTVSHSQDFLNAVCTDIIHITPTGKLDNYTGNFDRFVQTKEELETNQLKQYKKEQDDIKHIKAFIASCGTYSNLVRQAKSKQKIIDKMVARGLTEKPVPGPQYNFKFSPCDPLPPPVLSFHNVAFAYSGEMKDSLYNDVNLGVDLDSRVALVGPNGAGKSTLLKLMVGELMPTQGQVRRHIHLEIGRYHQHSNDQLDVEATPLEFMMRTFPDKKWEEQEWRKQVGRYGISGRFQSSKIGTLSDGLKSRLVFSMMATRNPNILLLDEPTNHLDIECIDALANAIKQFNGGLVLVSHDFRLIDQVAKEIWVCDNHTVSRWSGDIRSYKKDIINRWKKEEMSLID
jgi:ATP-binding cassette subfamily F protein 2